jgi:hypothetical protein
MADQEGLPLKDAIERAVGPLTSFYAAAAAWDAAKWDYSARQSERQPPDPEHRRIRSAFVREREATVVALARRRRMDRRDPTMGSTWRAPPAAAARRSRAIKDQGKSHRFHGASAARTRQTEALWTVSAGTSDSEPPTPASETTIRSNKDWIKWAAKSIPPDHREYGWKRAYAKKLADALNEAAKTNRALKPIKWESIVARLGEFDWFEKS